jgi:23S rRNA (cytidine2498-2'-O)-methyltransferase
MAHDFASLGVLTCDDGALDLAGAELEQQAPGAAVVAHLAPGVLLVDAARPFAELAAAWQSAPPIFVRHINPVQMAVRLTAGADDLPNLVRCVAEHPAGGVARPSAAAVGRLAPLDPRVSFSVQTRLLCPLPYKPFDVNNALAEEVATKVGAPLDVRNPAQVLSVVCAEVSAALLRTMFELPSAPKLAPVALLGVSPATANLSSWAGGLRRFAREEGQISRAEFKLLEALEVFAITLPPHGTALDLGAAPGGWTRVLRQRGQYVTAVDPGELDPRLRDDKAIRHRRMTAEDYLRSEPDLFDVIVNDMRMDARDSARLMVAYARFLYPHGVAIMTLKLPEAHRTPVVEHALQLLRQAFDVVGARQLFHNRSEITVALRPLRPAR